MNNKKDIKNRLIKGLFGEGFSQITNIFIRLCEIPIFLHYWGQTTYGQWLIFTSIPAYLLLFDFGLILSGAREMTMKISENELNKALSIYQTISVAVIFIIISIIILTNVALNFIPFEIFNTTSFDKNEVIFILSTLSLRVFFTTLITIFGLKLYCIGLYGLNTALQASFRLLGFFILSTVAFLGGNILDACRVILLEGLIGSLIISIYSRKKSPWLKLGFNNFSYSIIKDLFKPGLATLGLQIGNTSNLQGQIIVVGYILGAETATLFSIHRTLSRIPVQLFSSINSIFLPELSRSYNDLENPKLFTHLFRKLCKISFWGSFFICLTMIFFGEQIFDIWTKDKSTFYPTIFHILIVSAFVNSIWYVSLSSATATNQHINMSLYYFLVYGIGSVTLSIYTSHILKVNGAPLTLLASELVMLILILPNSIKIAKDNFKNWFFYILTPSFNVKTKSIR